MLYHWKARSILYQSLVNIFIDYEQLKTHNCLNLTTLSKFAYMNF